MQNQLSGQVEGKFVAEILHRKVEATNRHTRIVSIVKALAAHDSVLKVLTALTVCSRKERRRESHRKQDSFTTTRFLVRITEVA